MWDQCWTVHTLERDILTKEKLDIDTKLEAFLKKALSSGSAVLVFKKVCLMLIQSS
jgi:hypothetical protein